MDVFARASIDAAAAKAVDLVGGLDIVVSFNTRTITHKQAFSKSMYDMKQLICF